MMRVTLAACIATCSLSAVLFAWAYRLEVDQTALPYDFTFEKPQKGSAAPAAAGDDSEIADVIQFQLRPLFSASRRPVQVGNSEPAAEPVDVDAPPPEPVAEVPRLKLLGTEKAGGGSALIMDEDTGVSNWVVAGSSIGGWRVQEVQSDTVLLRSGEPTALPEGETGLTLSLYPEQAGP
ncbi:hypothetical protein N181_18565 [Sinorhizobium fredii USDA 205]|uniref:Type II secretion system protein GspC N-terminal domain-containing protein n=2 Tax=Rhizobium fredii TaxID=380 RepID=A0A844ADN4_RHIFR|nr:hypothetical protein [Sinorhizobium fredii]KSV87534.1 hypothetical protein N181_18565 [Sinorhizobium fredii USDA 205]MQW93590.1 hypothetical protein [Sinorhizobium fredii]MQX11229.1 hypothetical protein [Sinorhizobium fredii]UTY50390.1 hypothetical protein EPK84_28340 [Sinorhizobium fredii]CCE97178.1 conserved hypothetical protein [Sinorhizobium fredii HH103]